MAVRRRPTRGEQGNALALDEQLDDYFFGSYTPWCCLTHYVESRLTHSWHEANPMPERNG